MEKLRYGMVGGGAGSYIGETHRQAARMDHLAELTAGCFSRDHENSLATARLWSMADTSRVYRTWREMAAPEAFPTVEDGAGGMRFIAACVKSHRGGNVWVEL